MFCDKVRIVVRSGAGGKGSVSFHRAKYIPYGGPDGGDGGKGGDVYIRDNENLLTLSDFRRKRILESETGSRGKGGRKAGKQGRDLFIEVPIGTKVMIQSKKMELEINKGTLVKILEGGKGGIGNSKLANSLDRAPRRTIDPGLGEQCYLDLELNLLGDVGIIGPPNVGKSSFLNLISKAESKVGDFAFTTLEPKLGTRNKVVYVDLPGLVEGAAQGRGLGLTFLNQVKKCKFFLMFLDVTDRPVENFFVVTKELQSFGINKEFVVVLNKAELRKKKELMEIKKRIPGKVFILSVQMRAGVEKLVRFCESRCNKERVIEENKEN